MFTGCGNYQQALQLFRHVFSSIERTPFTPISTPLKLSGKVAVVKEEMELLQAKLVLGYAGEIAGANPLVPATVSYTHLCEKLMWGHSMSFSSNVKKELCAQKHGCSFCIGASLYACLLYTSRCV